MASTSISKAERSYIQAGILANPPSRADGRSLYDFRNIALETGVAPLANGSARLSIGRNPHDGSGGTEVLAAAKLEVENIGDGGEGVEGGRISCTVSCSPAAYPHLSSNALDDLQYDMTTILNETLTHRVLHPPNLGILRGKKAWVLHLDAVVLYDEGNVYDAVFMAARAALWDTKVPRTRSVEYQAKRKGGATKGNAEKEGGSGDMDVDEEVVSGFDTRQIQTATDFELPDYWDEGEPLGGRENWPVCVTLNIVQPSHFLDATQTEEAATPLRVLLMLAFDTPYPTSVLGMRTLGNGELTAAQIAELLKAGEKYAREIWTSLNAKLKEETMNRLKERSKF
ncbi:ribosomal protein S5 domain 2-like protein [Pholiota conissans]|uniref:Ribosomal RNA-processing protein 42 n=1 Tax=Pholiota conissans TaxID=109636 RepID=A0A9P5Z0X5_9AGAR|nr:ribosomal protein S5 domain 2-like protein [Pholiota conissans]